jgi:hypothetical protein
MMTGVVEERRVGTERIREVRPGCRGPTWGHAFRKNGSRRAANAFDISTKLLTNTILSRLSSDSYQIGMKLGRETYDEIHLCPITVGLVGS